MIKPPLCFTVAQIYFPYKPFVTLKLINFIPSEFFCLPCSQNNTLTRL